MDLMKPRYIDAVKELLDGVDVSGLVIGPYSELRIHGEVETPPTEEAIQTKLTELIGDWDAQEYARNRQAEYPSIIDVTVALAEKMEGNGQMWDEITALRLDVKSKYSKP